MRPDVGTQANFRKNKSPTTYRYDSSLSPALDWDSQNGVRELGEWLLGLIDDAAALPAPHKFDTPREFRSADGRVALTILSLTEAVSALKRIGKPFLTWAGKAERLSFDVPTLPLFVHERLSTKAIVETLIGHKRDKQIDLYCDVVRSHLNYVVADTKVWEQSAAYILDTHPKVEAFVKNAGLGFAIPYLHNGQPHDFVPDFIVRLATNSHLILETKGFDELAEVKSHAAERWVAAVNADGSFGTWSFAMARKAAEVRGILDRQ